MKRLIATIIAAGLIGAVFNVQAKTYTLTHCRQLALKNNRTVKEKKLELEVAEQVKKNARTGYFPKVDASAFAMRANKGLIEGEIPEMNLPVYDGNPASLQNPTQFTYFPGMELDMLDEAKVLSITAVQPLYAGGRIVNGNRLAALGVEVSRQQIELSESEIATVTENYFWTIIALQEKDKTIRSYETLLVNLQEDVQIAHDAGLAQKSDVLKVQLRLNEVRTQRAKLKNALELLRQNMSIHMGIPYDESIEFKDNYEQIIPPEKLFRKKADALPQRTEYQMLQNAVVAEKLQKKMTRGELLPEVFVGATATAIDVLDEKMGRGILFAGVNVPLSAWWGGYHRLKEHDTRIQIAENRIDETSELLQLQMEKAYRDLTESYSQIEIAQLTVTQSEEHLRVVKDNYDAGLVCMSDLLEAEAMYQQAQDALVDARTGYKIRSAEYLKVSSQD